MRTALLAATLLAAACTREPDPGATYVPPDNVTMESIRAPRDNSTSQISGLVKQRSEDGALMLDSGGPKMIPLRVGEQAKVTIDGKPGSGEQIREGDLVRAAYRFNDSGEAQALQVTANSKPIPTDRVQGAQQPSAPESR